MAAVAKREQASEAATRRIVEAFIVLLGEAVWKRKRLNVPGLGVFNVRTAKARTVRNPATGEPMRLQAVRVVKARVSAQWRTR